MEPAEVKDRILENISLSVKKVGAGARRGLRTPTLGAEMTRPGDIPELELWVLGTSLGRPWTPGFRPVLCCGDGVVDSPGDPLVRVRTPLCWVWGQLGGHSLNCGGGTLQVLWAWRHPWGPPLSWCWGQLWDPLLSCG